MKKFIIVLVIILQASYISAGDGLLSRLKPDQINLQFAGNIGFISVGTGYKFFQEVWQSDFLVGYVPESITDDEIYTLAWKNTFRLYSIPIKKYKISFHTAISFNLETGNNSYWNPDKHYPDGYYASNSYTAGIFLGSRFEVPLPQNEKLDSINFGVDVCSLASYMYYNITAGDERYYDIYSISFHTNLNF